MVEYRSTPPIPRSFGLLSSGSSYRFLPHTVPSPGCLSITPLATPGLVKPFGQPLCYSACTSYTCRTSTSLIALSLVPKCLFRPRVPLLPRYATSATRCRRDCDVTSPLLSQLLGEPNRISRRLPDYPNDRISRLLQNYLTGTRREGRDREDSGNMTSSPT